MASQALVAPLSETDASIEPNTPTVLVIDEDPDCLSHCAQLLDDLGYRHHCVSTAREALERFGRDPTIQIMLTGMDMPTMDGFVLIEEVRARSSGGRPVAVILLAQESTTELAVRGLHIEAVDLLLRRPVDPTAYSTALRRAMRYLAARRPAMDGANISNFGQQLSRLIAMLETKVPETKGELTDKEMRTTLRAIISSRGLRSRFFPDQLFADPAWDILLDLCRARLEGQQVSVSSACIAASVPMSTALRWVRQMTEAGLLRRWTDPKDRRRDLIALTDTTAGHMRGYLGAVHAILQKV